MDIWDFNLLTLILFGLTVPAFLSGRLSEAHIRHKIRAIAIPVGSLGTLIALVCLLRNLSHPWFWHELGDAFMPLAAGILIFGLDFYEENTVSHSWPEDCGVSTMQLFTEDHWVGLLHDAGFSNVESFRYGSKEGWAGTLILKGEK